MAEPEPSIFDEVDSVDPDVDQRNLARAEADIAAGRLVSHEAVKRWLTSWGTPNELPAPKCGE
jgi:predicted transcriptional regulator